MNNDNLNKLYESLQKEGYSDLGNYSEFSEKMRDENNRQKLYSAMKNDGYGDIGSFENFNGKLGFSSSQAIESLPTQIRGVISAENDTTYHLPSGNKSNDLPSKYKMDDVVFEKETPETNSSNGIPLLTSGGLKERMEANFNEKYSSPEKAKEWRDKGGSSYMRKFQLQTSIPDLDVLNLGSSNLGEALADNFEKFASKSNNRLKAQFENFKKNPNEYRISTNDYSNQELIPSALDYLETTRPITKKADGFSGEVRGKITDDELNQMKDFLTNTKEGRSFIEREEALFKQLEDSIAGLKAKISDMEQNSKKVTRSIYIPGASTYGSPGAYKDIEVPENYKDIDMAKSELLKLEMLRDAVNDRDKGASRQFFNELGRRSGEAAINAGTLGLSKLLYNRALGKILEDPDNELTIEARDLSAWYQSMHEADRSIAQDIARGVTDNADFIAQFAATGGMATALTKGTATAVAGKLGGNIAAKAIGQMAEGLGQAVVRTSLMPSTLASAYEINAENPGSFLDAYVQSWNRNFIENYSEGFGELLPAVGRFMPSNTTKAGKIANKIAKVTGFQGMIPEFMEEQLATVLHSASGDGQAQWSDLIDPRNHLITFGTIAMMQLPYSSINAGGYAAGKAHNIQQKRSINKAYQTNLRNMNSLFGEESVEIITAINERIDSDTKGVTIPDLLQLVETDNELTDPQKDALVKYGLSYDAYSGMKKAKTEEVEEAIKEVETKVVENINPGTNSIVTAIVSGYDQPVQISKGLVLNEDGSVNREESDKQIFFIDPKEGRTKVTSIDYIERVVENIPAEEAIRIGVEYRTAPIVATQENEEVRQYNPGEIIKVKGNPPMIGQINGYDETTGRYSVIIPTEQEDQELQIEPREIFSSDIEDISVEELNNQINELDSALESGILEDFQISQALLEKERIQFELSKRDSQEEIAIYSKNQNDTNSENNEQIVENDDVNSIENANIPPSEDSKVSNIDIIRESAPKQKDGSVDYDTLLESDPESFAILYESEEGAEETIKELTSISENIAKKIASAEKKLENADSINKRKAARVEISDLQAKKNNVDSIIQNLSPGEVQELIEQPSTELDRLVSITENSTDLGEISSAYSEAMQTAENENLKEWEQMLIGRRVNRASFERFGDRNMINVAIARSWFNRKGEEGTMGSIDVIAEELGVTEQDIIDFILEHPSNRIKKGNDLTKALNNRFKIVASQLAGQPVGGIDSNSGRLFMKALEIGSDAARQEAVNASPVAEVPVPDSFIQLLESSDINIENISTFEELEEAINEAKESLWQFSDEDYQEIQNFINHAIQTETYSRTVERVEEARNQRAAIENFAEQPSAGNRGEPERITPSRENNSGGIRDEAERITRDQEVETNRDESANTEGVHSQHESVQEAQEKKDESSGESESSSQTKEETTEGDNEFSDDTSDSRISRPDDGGVGEIDYSQPIERFAANVVKNAEIEAARQEVGQNPTEAQIEAGNYKKGHVSIQGFDISIENPKGSERSGVDPNGKAWSITMQNDYGYIRDTKGSDHEQIDVFIGPAPLSEKIFVVDRVNQDGSFDEHKALIGFSSIEEAREAYLSNYEEGWQGLGNITETDIDSFRDWVGMNGRRVKPFSDYKSVNTELSTPTSSNSIPSGVQKIEDFGEKIGGARKDLAAEYLAKIKKTTEESIKTLPLSKALPKPNLKLMVEQGVLSSENAILIDFIYSKLPTKPRQSWRLSTWAKEVEQAKVLISDILTSNDNTLFEKFSDQNNSFNVFARTMQAINFPASDVKTGKYRIEQPFSDGMYALYNGNRFVARSSDFNEIIEKYKEAISISSASDKKRQVAINVYQKRGKNEFFIGKTIQGKPPVKLTENFDSLSEASQYLLEHREELEQKWDQINVNPNERRDSNRERQGTDWRKGVDATPEQFSETFGFRGVEFGNWVNQSERQSSLNDAYDALMDLSETIGVSPRALSLNGELGFAFGARGRGGNAMAHYEPDKVVINLTKTKGAGSLAHEWWHALDNYFSKKRGVELGYVTSDARSFGQNEVVRKEMIDAFKDIMIAIGKSGVPTRSRKLDSTKSKSYWESKEEMSARSFENYIVGKMSENGNRNDYLANYRDLVEWAGESNLDESTYPYPTKDESPEINEKFQQFFDTIEEVSNDETGNVMLNEPQSQLDWQHDTDHVSQMEVTPELEKVREEAGYKAEDTGEVTYMERQLSEQGHLTFMGAPLTGAPKIHSSADVAFLFKNLESAATENSFMVMIREDGTYGVYYASTGATAATVVDIKLLVAAAKDFGAARVCFVHNHPSGNLTSSPQDKVIHKRLRSALPGMGIDLMDSIVINLDSGQYLEFDEYGGGKQSKDADPKEIVKPKIYQFDKQVLYQPSLERMRIQSSDDVAKFLSIQKRGAVPKIQALVVDAANRVSKYMFLDPNMSRTELVSTLLYEIGKHGENVIFASNAQIDPSLIQSLRQRLESAGIGNSNTGNPAILDVLEIQQDADIINNYKSWANEGVLEPNSEYNILNERQNNVSLNDIINENGEINYENLEEVSRRTESGDTTITRLNPEEEQGRIRGGRKAIEASILSGAARRPDRGRLPTTGAETAKVEESILKKYAEDTSSLLSREDIESMSVRKFPSGQESEVYESKDGENVIKIVNYKMYSETPLEFLDNRISLNNYIFPETAYKLIGFTETKNGLSFVLEQPFIQGSNLNKFAISVESLVKQQSRVFDHMKDELGASMIGTSRTGFYNDNYVIEDLHLNNVKEGADGNLYFIDSVISLNEESDNLGGYRKYEDFSIGNTNAESAQSVSEPVPSYPQKPNLSEDKDIQVSSEAPAAYPNESIIDYAKRVSLWWNAKQKEVDKTTQDFNKATAELRKLRYSYNQITKKYNQGSKEILERTKNTAKEIETYIRENLDSEIADWMGLGELRGLLARLHNPTSKKDVESAILAIDKTLNIIERRKNRKMLDALLMTKVLDQNKKGVSIAKTVDDDTRKSIEYIRENQELSEAEIDQRIENIENSATNGLIPEEEIQTISDLEMIRLLSRINAFENNIKQIDQEIKDENKRASDEINGIDPGDKAALKDARFTHRRISQSLQRERIIAQSDLNNAYSDAINELNSLITNGRSKLAEQKRKELERRNVIAREAVGAVKDKPVLSQAAEKERSKLDKFKEFLQTNKLKELFLSPQGNLNFMLKYIDRNHPMGEGKLYKRFMKSEEGAVQANENYYLGEREFRKEIKEKAEKIFDAKFSQIIDDSRQNSGIYLEYYDRAGEKHTSKMTKGELMYLYMVSRMEDGKEKLEFMGITDDNINQIANNLGSRYLQMADWIQKEFLPEKRKKYNATHKRLFGTSMAKRENYFPLQYNTKDIQPNSDIANLNNSYYMPSTMTGNIINRVRNKHQIDINANAFDVLMKHGRDMEEWNAYAPLRRDFNGLLNNGYVRNLIEANDKLAFKKLKDAVVVATRAHQEDPNASHFLADLNRRFAGAAIAFRLNTALKQLLSLPAFLEYSNSPKYIGRLFRNLSPDVWAKNFEWAKENLPGFLERWESGNFGNEKLLVDQWENSNKRRSKLEKGLDTYAKIGMWPNRLVDAFAVTIGSKAIYDQAKEIYLKKGDNEQEAERKALFDAAVVYNEAQQSSQPEFLSPLQTKKDVFNRGVTTFMNANFSFLRKFSEGINELFHSSEKEIKQLTKENIESGMDPKEAEAEAKSVVYGAKGKAVKNIILFGFFMQMTWELAEQMLYGLWDDDDEKEKDIIKAAVISPISGLYMGSMAASAINGYKANPLIMFSEGEKRWRDIEKAYKNNGLFSPSVGIAAIKAMIQAGGINYNTWLNMYTAIEQAVENGDWNATNTYYFLNAPASVRKSFASKIKDNENILDYGSRVKDAHNRELETKELKALAKKKIFSDNGDMTDFNRLYALGKEWEKVRKAEKNLPEKSDLYKVLEKMNKNEALSKLYKMSDEIAGYYADYMRGDTIIPLMEEGIEQKRRQIHELIKEIKGNSK